MLKNFESCANGMEVICSHEISNFKGAESSIRSLSQSQFPLIVFNDPSCDPQNVMCRYYDKNTFYSILLLHSEWT